jgi:2-dehydropantoate 2-reductase
MLYAARLALVGISVLLLDYRPERAAAMQASGLRLTDETGTRAVSMRCTTDPTALAEVDVAIILVKAHQTEDAASVLADHLSHEAVALTLQNGLGNIEVLEAHLGRDRVLGGTTTQGAAVLEPGAVHDTGSGVTTLGAMSPSALPHVRPIAEALAGAGFAVSVAGDVAVAIWSKAILNAALNPVAALTRLRNGELAEHEESLALMTAAAREAHAIARKHGIAVPATDWRTRLTAVCRATAANTNSMLADLRHGRRTEIDAINGAIVRIADLHNRTAPVNRTLWYLVKTAEMQLDTRTSGD